MSGYAGPERVARQTILPKLVCWSNHSRLKCSPKGARSLICPKGSTPGILLIVDDDKKIREFLRSALEQEGYSVQDTATAQMHSPESRNAVRPGTHRHRHADIEGIDLIKRMRGVAGGISIIAMSGASTGISRPRSFWRRCHHSETR